MRWLPGLLVLVLGVVPLTAQTATGLAGVITDNLGGRVTASGDPYDPKAFTAASPSLRLGLRLAVTNPANGRTITVRVIDRAASDRLLDLSRAAADALGVAGGVVVPVEIRALTVDQKDITVLGPTPVPAAPVPAPKAAFVPTPPPVAWFQLGAFRTLSNARNLAAQLVRQGYKPVVLKTVLYRVYLSVPESESAGLVKALMADGRKGFFELAKAPEGSAVALTTP